MIVFQHDSPLIAPSLSHLRIRQEFVVFGSCGDISSNKPRAVPNPHNADGQEIELEYLHP